MQEILKWSSWLINIETKWVTSRWENLPLWLGVGKVQTSSVFSFLFFVFKVSERRCFEPNLTKWFSVASVCLLINYNNKLKSSQCIVLSCCGEYLVTENKPLEFLIFRGADEREFVLWIRSCCSGQVTINCGKIKQVTLCLLLHHLLPLLCFSCSRRPLLVWMSCWGTSAVCNMPTHSSPPGLMTTPASVSTCRHKHTSTQTHTTLCSDSLNDNESSTTCDRFISDVQCITVKQQITFII